MGNKASSSQEVKTLQKLNMDNVPHFVKNRNVLARVKDVYDGDTMTVVFLFENKPVQLKIRLSGVDTCEMPRRKDQSDRTPHEVEIATAARDFCRGLVLGDCVYIEMYKWGKYGGRVIGNVFRINNKGQPTGASLSQQLLEKGLAVPYSGAKKSVDWEDQYQIWKAKMEQSPRE